jgi:hypothetical protein
MLRVDLQSTSLKAVTYQDRSARLELEFRSGAIYRYSDVPALIYQELLRAESNGRYFNQHIRNRFTHSKINPAPSGPTHASAVDQGS